ncbi:MAG: non-heme iron oxygenase ferredoxin subunit [Candidatus Nitrosocaldus sp.]|nr:non-heme iron oxygenase ferredoxin subunit [Candidatus Nitrosocaldus sp.]MCS7141008.1 non-heme iron oxygenase ferredoxin subunit [Candidatus Nitrosocaldus sp.]MDW7999914.1 non-heme iron oxygenase ferredoxin subunit [Candidatus Nitrosocaldus sp.]MDW8276296.1 non-heme iron oxygenase ferredoxin subunit [Candidatus Nitrosocaldus sp.]
MNWVRVCSRQDLRDGEILSMDVEGRQLMLIAQNGKVYALDRICTHMDADLSMGFLAEGQVTCPLHLSAFRLEDGMALNPPAERPLRRYNVKIDGNDIYVQVV